MSLRTSPSPSPLAPRPSPLAHGPEIGLRYFFHAAHLRGQTRARITRQHVTREAALRLLPPHTPSSQRAQRPRPPPRLSLYRLSAANCDTPPDITSPHHTTIAPARPLLAALSSFVRGLRLSPFSPLLSFRPGSEILSPRSPLKHRPRPCTAPPDPAQNSQSAHFATAVSFSGPSSGPSAPLCPPLPLSAQHRALSCLSFFLSAAIRRFCSIASVSAVLALFPSSSSSSSSPTKVSLLVQSLFTFHYVASHCPFRKKKRLLIADMIVVLFPGFFAPIALVSQIKVYKRLQSLQV
ncbi:hypothetical protein HG535_0C02690 [Zygotorulaspora mrakii]|uniref:Uncharacterized protein n=1 Tax=Zygotorulaspora mrakii TaxID=42260 RepID=A0A7H9B0C4_ZYGMR|nr:uncharacterized protein HG535_0C02690 [Zygotorulaspora mrakii]QLG71917.1 hypothetical protein HG535_0C02690 [Zygotorulaspora mrakii]